MKKDIDKTTIQADDSPLTQAEIERNKIDEMRRKLRVIQIIQKPNGRIEVMPIQNITYRSDIIGILNQALNDINNEDIVRESYDLFTKINSEDSNIKK
jgi:hypothetical protein